MQRSVSEQSEELQVAGKDESSQGPLRQGRFQNAEHGGGGEVCLLDQSLFIDFKMAGGGEFEQLEVVGLHLLRADQFLVAQLQVASCLAQYRFQGAL
jgi:hypothetical protein